jgi:DNA polymerase III subunit gamma/tau
MAYKALYRTYRPQKFSEVVGQDHIVRTLQNALANGKISHAYLFTGPRGTGKTSVARILAKALNCTAAEGSEPCGKCVSCREIAESNNPDVVEIDAASNNGVDEIRDIRDKVKFLPAGSRYKIYIIDEVHMLTQGAFNALLKTLEEPPKHAIFILATTEPHKVLPTIISRCQRFDFKTLSVKEISSRIRRVVSEEGFNISEEAIIAISEGAEGGMRDALSYLDQAASFSDGEITIDDVNSVTGNLNYDKIIQLATYFENKDVNQALKTISDLVMMGKEVNKVVSGMLQFYRDVLLYKNIDTSMFTKYIYEKAEFKNLVERIDARKIFFYVDILSEVQTRIKTSSTPAIHLDVAVIKLINGFEDNDILNRLKKLETTGPGGDNHKLSFLEERVERIIAELSRLELPNLVERMRKIEDNPNYDRDIKARLDYFQDQLADLKKSLEESKSNRNPVNPEANLQYQGTNQRKEIEAYLDERAADFDSMQQALRDKISQLEKQIDRLNQPILQTRKIKRKRVSDDQLVFYGDKVVALKELEEQQQESEPENDDFSEEAENDINTVNKDGTNIIQLNESEETDIPDAEPQVIIPEEAKAEQLTTVREEIKGNEHSHLVRRIAPIPDAIEVRAIIPEKPEPQEKEPEPVEEIEDPLKNLTDEEYNNYHVTVLERILHSSRTGKAREDKIRIVNLWKSMVRNCPPEAITVAEMLQEGQIVAVGEREFIITYPNVHMCNEVMKTKFKRRSLKLLYDFLGEAYNYMALPEEAWIEKRTEYINQYNIGIKYPKLTPINNPDLVVETGEKDLSARDKLVNETIRILGQDIVKIE